MTRFTPARRLHNGRSSVSGFTLIELVATIVILGILAATAVPRFADLSDTAHDSRYLSTRGALKSSASIVHARWIIEGSNDATVLVNGISYTMSPTGYPKRDADNGAGCVSFWDKMFNGEPTATSSAPLPPGSASDVWSAGYFGPVFGCVFTYQADADQVDGNGVIRAFRYDSVTGETLSFP